VRVWGLETLETGTRPEVSVGWRHRASRAEFRGEAATKFRARRRFIDPYLPPYSPVARRYSPVFGIRWFSKTRHEGIGRISRRHRRAASTNYDSTPLTPPAAPPPTGYGPRPCQRATSASARSRSGRTFPASRGHRSVAAQGRSRSVPCRRRRRRSRATNPAIGGGLTLRFGGRARASMSVARTLRFPDGPELPLDQRPIETGHRHC
jgi:hypothetical protein